MVFIAGHLSLITKLRNKINSSVFFKRYLHANALTKQAEDVLSRHIRFGSSKRQRKTIKRKQELPIIVGDIGEEALPKVQESNSNESKKNVSEEPDRVDDWLSSAFSNGLDKIQDIPKPSELPFSHDESIRDFSCDPVSSPEKRIAHTSLNLNTFVGYFDPDQIRSNFDLQSSLTEQLKEFKYCRISSLNTYGFFAFKFPTEDQEILVLEHGQLFIDNKPLILKRWSPSISLVPTLFLSAIPIWVRFHNLNWAYWTQTCLSKISSIIGIPLFMDKCTATMGRLDYARVCVEISTDLLHLPDTVHMLRNGKIIPVSVEYEWKPEQCLFCLSIYHESDTCQVVLGGEIVFPAEKLFLVKSNLHQEGKETQGASFESSYSSENITGLTICRADSDGTADTISVRSGPQFVESSIEESLDDALEERMRFLHFD